MQPKQSGGNSQQSPRTISGLHAELLELWKKFLKTEDTSIDDDFFEKGGDSIVALELHLELQRRVGRKLPESLVFEAPTVRDLAQRLAPLTGMHDEGRRA